MNTHSYSILRWEYGWTLEGERGIPMNALAEALPLFEKNTYEFPGISHHLKQTSRPDTIMTIATQPNSESWIAKIKESLAGACPQEQWWKGTDVGTSSAAIFSVLCDREWQGSASKLGGSATPRDADDLGRCIRLLEKFPEWEPRLTEVAQAYPNTPWTTIVPNWDIIKTLPHQEQNDFLQNL